MRKAEHIMKRLVLVSVAALSFAACGGGDELAATATEGDEFCRLAQIAKDDNDALDNVDFTDPAAVKLELGAAIDSLSAASAKAPKDIAETVKTLLTAEEKLEDVLADNDYDVVKMSASEEGKALSEDGTTEAAGDDLEAYLNDKCGIETDDTAVDDTLVPDVSAPIGIDLGEGGTESRGGIRGHAAQHETIAQPSAPAITSPSVRALVALV